MESSPPIDYEMVAAGVMLFSHLESLCCAAVWAVPAFKCALEIKLGMEVVTGE